LYFDIGILWAAALNVLETLARRENTDDHVSIGAQNLCPVFAVKQVSEMGLDTEQN